MYKILPLHLLLDVCSSYMRNYHMPHGGYLHHADFPMQHVNNHHQYYDGYSSEKIVMRQSTRYQPPRRHKYHRHIEYSDSEYKYKCECSCVKCQKRKPKRNSCCDEFCATECAVQNNILVVPYPVPFMIFNQSAQEIPPPHTSPPTTSSSTTTTTTTTTERTTTTRKKDDVSFSTVPYFETQPKVTYSTIPYYDTQPEVTFSTVPYLDTKSFKCFRIVDEKNLRRNNNVPKNVLRSSKFDRIPKYGIVPIPENLAVSLMQQIRKDQRNDQLRKRLAVNKNLLDFNRKPIA